MAISHNLGFPRIGSHRQLKFSSESYWRGDITQHQLHQSIADLQQQQALQQVATGLDLVPCGDFSLYDHVLDTSFLVGNIPERFAENPGNSLLDQYYRVARGAAPSGGATFAGEMTKWFDTNYHYIVPEIHAFTEFSAHTDVLIEKIRLSAQATQRTFEHVKPVILGPLSYLWLSKTPSSSVDKLRLLDKLLPVYQQIFQEIAALGIHWVQIDEPILALDLPPRWQQRFESSYHTLHQNNLNFLLTTYFGPLQDNLKLACELPVAGLHIDAVRAKQEVPKVLDLLPVHKVLSLGIIDGRNIWKSDLNSLVDWLLPIHAQLENRLWLAPSCSLLHVPVDLNVETEMDPELKNWLAFAEQKLAELHIIKTALNRGKDQVKKSLDVNQAAFRSRLQSPKVHNASVQRRLAETTLADTQRKSPFVVRAAIQQGHLQLPLFPTTTIGSFPQTADIRACRNQFRQGRIDLEHYEAEIKKHIAQAVAEQEKIGLDVLVHGEAERNDMVEYFGEQLEGYGFTQMGWVQSYGTRCVKPPFIYGDVARPKAMTVSWSQYAQSLTSKPMKGMLSGPITMLQWAFVRDDQERSVTAKQIALALRDEVLDLERAGIKLIQVDEPALREGLPLRKQHWAEYLAWAVQAFQLTTAGVEDATQIHTHMCYAQFNDIIQAISALDADVITIETSRSNMALLSAFTDFHYPNGIGPGVYDIHSPNLPTATQMLKLLHLANRHIPATRLWVNPDCGLKTRQWPEVREALTTMVAVAKQLRYEHAPQGQVIAEETL